MADDEQSGWQLTESDPGVFTELLKLLGTPMVMDELWTLDSSTLLHDPITSISPIQALVFLFKWTADRERDEDAAGGGPRTGGTYDPAFGENGGFYAKQVVQNACATLAIVNALGNIPALEVGSALGNIFSFGVGMDSWTLGELLTSSSELREIHNSLSPPSAISLDGLNLPKGEAEDAYHFVVYLPINGSLYELDGLKRDAVTHGSLNGGNWLEKALDVIQRRIELYPTGAIEFNLQAIRPDPLKLLSNPSSIPAHLSQSDIEDILHNEKIKRQRWDFENAVRRHNHLGLAVGLLGALAKASLAAGPPGPDDLWNKTITNAKGKMTERIEKRKEILKMAGKDPSAAAGVGMDLDE